MATARRKAAPDPRTVGDPSLYERDFYAWTLDQEDAIRSGRSEALDRTHLAEELAELGTEVFNALRSSFRVILLHLLKWDHQPHRRSRSWTVSIRTQRIEIEAILDGSPSLRRRQGEAIAIAYRQARIHAAAQMKVAERLVPPECPYTLDEILHRPFPWPEA